MTVQQKISAKINARTTASLMEMAAALYTDARAEASLVLSSVLDVLMARLPEPDFVTFCEKLEGP